MLGRAGVEITHDYEIVELGRATFVMPRAHALAEPVPARIMRAFAGTRPQPPNHNRHREDPAGPLAGRDPDEKKVAEMGEHPFVEHLHVGPGIEGLVDDLQAGGGGIPTRGESNSISPARSAGSLPASAMSARQRRWPDHDAGVQASSSLSSRFIASSGCPYLRSCAGGCDSRAERDALELVALAPREDR